MKASTNITSFFSLEGFIYKELWKQEAWSALLYLKSFFSKVSLFKINSSFGQSVFLENSSKIAIGKNTIIEPGVFIKGPCIIGDNCEIRHGAYIREHVIIGNNCIVGHASEIKHSILLPFSSAAHFAYIGDSIIGHSVNLGAGVRCANFRLDQKEIRIKIEDSYLSTGMNKLGAIIGDGCQIGCNTVLNPGTCLQKFVSCHPNLTVSGLIETESIIAANNVILPLKKKQALKSKQSLTTSRQFN